MVASFVLLTRTGRETQLIGLPWAFKSTMSHNQSPDAAALHCQARKELKIVDS
jgi:hypothetical protein